MTRAWKSVILGVVVLLGIVLQQKFRDDVLTDSLSRSSTRVGSTEENSDYNSQHWIQVARSNSKLEALPSTDRLCFSVCGRKTCSGDLKPREPIPCKNKSARKQMRRPDYFTIGYSQAGSTYFEKLLTEHPRITKACRKEVHFFDNDLLDQHSTRFAELKGYLTCFPRAGLVTGDNTVKTIYTDSALPLWLKAVNPDFKLIVLLRNPIDRARSRYAMKGGGAKCSERFSKRICQERFSKYVLLELERLRRDCPVLFAPRTTDEAVMASLNCSTSSSQKLDADTLVSSLYGYHISYWMKFFPKKQFLFVDSTRLFKEPNKTLAKVTSFLGVPGFDFAPYQPAEKHNSHLGGKEELSPKYDLSLEAKQQLDSFLAHSNEIVRQVTGIDLR